MFSSMGFVLVLVSLDATDLDEGFCSFGESKKDKVESDRLTS